MSRAQSCSLLFLLLLVPSSGCDDSDGQSDADVSSDGDVDVDGDSDGDGDGDTDVDGDADSDPDGGGPDGEPDPPCEGEPEGDGSLSGSLVAWHPLELRFDGPAADELDSSPNPFVDYRLIVTFTGPLGQEYAVPGFFDGDGEGGGAGSVWTARFSPDQGGEWTYEVSFRSGEGVAFSADSGAGEAGGLDGGSGRFCVQPMDRAAPGFLGHGRLEYVGEHYLRLADGTYWIKAGADSPENFLGYAGFDNTVDQAGGASTEGLADGVHRYASHVSDWSEGDPDWDDGAGRGIIGALNYLASEEVNSIYFLPCNLGGDGRETHPYVAPDDLLHMDLSKLHQWELVFRHAQRLGIALHFVLTETEEGNETLHDDGTLGVERMLFYRELVARFGHHLGLFWNIGEENDYGAERQRQFAGFLRDVDPYDHPLTVHTHANRPGDQYTPLVGDERFDLTSIQLSPARAGEFTEEWREQSAAAGRPWAVMLDEIGPAGEGVTDTNAPTIRRLTLWPALLSGSAGVEWYFGYHPLPLGGDMRCEDFRTRSEMWLYTRIATRFMHEHLPFWEMEPADELLTGETGAGEVFALVGEVYAVYLPDAGASGSLDLNGAAGELEIFWLDPRTGELGEGRAVAGGAPVALGTAPSSPSEDWVVLVQRTGGTANARPVARIDAAPTSGDAPLNVTFDGSRSSDSDGAISSYHWDFGDGEEGEGESLVHEYGRAGSFTVRLTVTDDLGAVGTATERITVGDAVGPTVTRLVLINATSDTDIGPLGEGDTLDLSALGTTELNVRAETSPATVGSVRFGLDADGAYTTENVAPYSLAGDASGDYNAWTPAAGAHSISATAYAGADATGTAGAPLSVSFTVR